MNYRASRRGSGREFPVCLNDIEINERKTKLASRARGAARCPRARLRRYQRRNKATRNGTERNGTAGCGIKAIPKQERRVELRRLQARTRARGCLCFRRSARVIFGRRVTMKARLSKVGRCGKKALKEDYILWRNCPSRWCAREFLRRMLRLT